MKLPATIVPIAGLACVAATSAFVMWTGNRMLDVLASPTWCARALGAPKDNGARVTAGLEGCVELLKLQLGALSLNSHIVLGTLALCLGVLVIVLLADARVQVARNADGSFSGNVGRDTLAPDQAAAKIDAAGQALSEAAGAMTDQQP